jgi:peptidoglycan/xylan/chitin deacetylase (PgdA/CDA1 family)
MTALAVLTACALAGWAGWGGRASAARTSIAVLSGNARAVGIAGDPATGGYWVLKSTGGVESFHAPWKGSLAGRLRAGLAVTAIAAGRRGGYRILVSNGAVHGFGAPVYGSDAGRLLPGVRAIGLATDPATGGYWVLRSDGGIDAFHAPWRGSLARRLPPVSAVSGISAVSRGYRVLTSAGGGVPAGLGGRQWDVLPTRRKVVALTFDIGPTNGVKSILATLRRDHVRATFFLTGRQAVNEQSAARAIAAADELVGNHSNNHPNFTRISDQRIGEEVRTAQARIESVTGRVTWPWLRFPYGAHDQHTIAVLNSLGYVAVGWTVDSLGWEGYSGGITVREIVHRVLAARRPGEIVLMHGGSDSGDGSAPDADALPTVIRRLRADGYSFVRMDFLHGFGPAAHRVDGAVRCFGARSYGSDAAKLPAGVTAVGIAADPATGGYWILKSTGGVDNFHAPWRGSVAGKMRAGAPVMAIAAGRPGGYLVLSSDGTVHAFGTPWYGSAVGVP